MNEARLLTNSKHLTKNTFWNLLGLGLPLLVGIATIPLLINAMSLERFGVLTLAWMVIGYFSIFDLGLGRALTKLISEKIGSGDNKTIPELIWTALALMFLLSIIGSIVVAAISQWLVYDVLNISITLQDETLSAFYALALSIPFVVSTAGLRGILEAYQKFKLLHFIRIPMGLFTFISPLVVLMFSPSFCWYFSSPT